MRVLHVIPSISSALGGPTQVVLNLVKALLNYGIDAEIVTTNDNGADLLDVPLNQRVEYQQVPVWFLPRFSPPLKEFIFSPALTRWLQRSIHHYDILDNHYLFSYAPTCAAVIARRQQTPYTVRTMGQLAPWALNQSRLKKQLYSHLIERRNLTHAAAIHCTSPSEAQDVQRFGIQTPTITLPLGVDLPSPIPEAPRQLRQTYAIPTERPLILFLSRLHYKKRPDLLLRSLHQLITRNQDAHLLLAGSGEPSYITELQSLIHELGLGDRITFTGFVEGPQKDLLLQGSDLFVLPSFSENFGIAVAEALAAGLPVVITPGIQISAEIADAQAGLVVEGELEPLTQALIQLVEHPKLRQQLGQNGQTLVQQRYSWDTIATNLASVYQIIIQERRLSSNVVF